MKDMNGNEIEVGSVVNSYYQDGIIVTNTYSDGTFDGYVDKGYIVKYTNMYAECVEVVK